jgi:hypothetical protein
MRERFSGSRVTVAIAAAAVSAAISVPVTRTSAQVPAVSGTALKTPWGEPDLQGIWTDEFDAALQRPPRYANQEIFTEAQREELDKERSALYGEERPAERGTEFDVARAYNHAVFLSNKHVGARTSLIVDPLNGRIPRLTPEAQKIAAGDREFVSPCCKRPRHARPSRQHVAAGNTIRRPRRDAQTFLLATTLCA